MTKTSIIRVLSHDVRYAKRTLSASLVPYTKAKRIETNVAKMDAHGELYAGKPGNNPSRTLPRPFKSKHGKTKVTYWINGVMCIRYE